MNRFKDSRSSLVHAFVHKRLFIKIITWIQSRLFLEVLGGLEKGRWGSKAVRNCLLGAGVLGDSLGSLRDGVLGQLSGKDQTDGGLDFPAGDGGTLVVVGKLGSFAGNTLEDVIDVETTLSV